MLTSSYSLKQFSSVLEGESTLSRTVFVTRHSGVRDWAARHGYGGAESIQHLDEETLRRLRPGDRVLGSLPVTLIADVCSRGARYFHFMIDAPSDARGRDLSADEMESFDARLQEFTAKRVPEN